MAGELPECKNPPPRSRNFECHSQPYPFGRASLRLRRPSAVRALRAWHAPIALSAHPQEPADEGAVATALNAMPACSATALRPAGETTDLVSNEIPRSHSTEPGRLQARSEPPRAAAACQRKVGKVDKAQQQRRPRIRPRRRLKVKMLLGVLHAAQSQEERAAHAQRRRSPGCLPAIAATRHAVVTGRALQLRACGTR
jgi:hypothetical protein